MQSLSALFMLKCLPFSMSKSCDATLNSVKAILYLRKCIVSRYISCVSSRLYQLYVDSLFDSSTEVFHG